MNVVERERENHTYLTLVSLPHRPPELYALHHITSPHYIHTDSDPRIRVTSTYIHEKSCSVIG